ncbi:MAG TPA: carboxypeptidase regulatory-like domain-containing protein [Vicinamibacterales bacterium]|nr:carboxypeptidase regulatory-like domain-containing protein [Vicinamibacterales bacterium]
MKRGIHTLFVVLAMLLVSASAFAQGGGASTTGSINGKVEDSSGAVLPGVTVTVASPSLMGVQTAVTDTGGNYRFPALPPGTYTVTFELPGFNTLKRENIQIAMGFTAAVNVQLAVASLQETVTVTGDSPVIDTSNTRVQQNFKLEQLQELPNARDLWALLAVTPSVTMGRIDVGGNRAGTQTGYTSYGYSGQNRVLVEGINTTEGTSGAGFYVDYGSFEEVFLGTIAQGAEMPTPGVQSQMLGKSGGNKFQGELYQDYETNGMIGENIIKNVPSKFLFDPVTNPGGNIRPHSNETLKYRDSNINVGGPIEKDKVWWYFSYRNFKNSVGQPNFIGPIAGLSFDTNLWNPSGKVTYQINQNNKLIGYYQWGQKTQPNRLPQGSLNYTDLGGTLKQISGSWIYKGEWNGTLSNNMFAEARYGGFGYYFPLLANTDTNLPEIFDNKNALLINGDQKEQTDRRRLQATGSLTYFKDGWGGTHNFKIGGEFLFEYGWYGYTQVASGNQRTTLATTGVPSSFAFYAPTALSVGSLGDGPSGNLLSVDRVNTKDFFVTDQYTVGRATFNLGFRYDQYDVFTPDQTQLAYTFPTGVSIPAASCSTNPGFCETHYLNWKSFVPRIGMTYDLSGTGKTVVKLNYGMYRFNPGVGVAASANPNQATKSITYNSKVAGAGDTVYYQDPTTGVKYTTNTLTATALAGTISVDPAIAQPYSHQATAYLEQQVTEGVGARIGFVYYSVKNQTGTFQPLRPASAYTVPFNVTDPGLDGVTGTGDDKTLTAYGIPSNLISGCTASTTTVTPTCAYPTNNVVTNSPDNGNYKTFEFSLNKRQSHNYSVSGGFGYTWQHDFPYGAPNTPNGPFDYDFSTYSAKASVTYNAPFGIFLSGIYRYQAGANYARRVTVAAPGSCACSFSAAAGSNGSLANGSLTANNIFATDLNAFRQDNFSIIDLRVEKTVKLGSDLKVRLFLDGFNLTNQYAAETITTTAGANFQQPTAILAPRTARIGARLIW